MGVTVNLLMFFHPQTDGQMEQRTRSNSAIYHNCATTPPIIVLLVDLPSLQIMSFDLEEFLLSVSSSSFPQADKMASHMKTIHQELKEHFTRARADYKKYADQRFIPEID
ncbi:hypothetical protein DSO57_1003619 [Entomophthora muscae]|uniref:Uncharacterized protein n=1 Tax=Entomophthora muscae TaxID=34485 RepID=A0ACC2SL90_9FUNG|nr:hypothetical protein DSO57_1003619 [Entomophthora muscae]